MTWLHLRPDDIPAAEGIVLAIGERLLRIPPEHLTIASRLVGLRHPFSAEDAAMLAGVSTGEMQAIIEALVGEQVLVRLDA